MPIHTDTDTEKETDTATATDIATDTGTDTDTAEHAVQHLWAKDWWTHRGKIPRHTYNMHAFVCMCIYTIEIPSIQYALLFGTFRPWSDPVGTRQLKRFAAARSSKKKLRVQLCTSVHTFVF